MVDHETIGIDSSAESIHPLQRLTSMAEHSTQARASVLLNGDMERKAHNWIPLDERAHFCVDAERYG